MLWIFLLGCVCWAFWIIRNDWVFENTLVSSPLLTVYKALSFAQKWGVLLGNEEQAVLGGWCEAILKKLIINLELELCLQLCECSQSTIVCGVCCGGFLFSCYAECL